MRTKFRCFVGIAWLCYPSFGFAQGIPDEFPSSPIIDRQVSFWEKVFSTYKSDEFILHDRDNLDIVLNCLKVPVSSKPGAEDGPVSPPEDEIEAYRKAMRRFVTEGYEARNQGRREKEIWDAYLKNHAIKELLSGNANLRVQGGLADTFLDASHRAELYLPLMERIFREHGLPTDLTRIVFVESMFNLKARSKVGASGFWQLMPGSAKSYIKVDHKRDERNSPLIATKAAAGILRSNYKALEQWPLAVTAYNHGQGGMKRAIAKLKTKDLSEIILLYDSPSFGFASRNFYSEFLAAIKVHRQRMEQPVLSKASAVRPNKG